MGSVSKSLAAVVTVARRALQHRRIAPPVLPRMARFGVTARHRPRDTRANVVLTQHVLATENEPSMKGLTVKL